MITSRHARSSWSALVLFAALALAAPRAAAQSPSVLYTWDGPPSVEDWVKNFGTNTVTLDNNTPGSLTITETGSAGSNVSISDGANRVRETSTAQGGLDLTGLDFLEFDIGHNGAAPINVQFYVQASTGFTFQALGPDVSVTPGVNTYQLPLSGLTANEIVYIRTLGFNARDHVPLSNVTWTLNEVRSGGTPLTTRTLITHDTGSAENGLQGAIVNFDNAAIQGNNGGQNQTGLSHNPSGSGSLQWTDVGGSNGGAVSWGNGTAWNGNTFNYRITDVSNYAFVVFRMSATDATGGGGTVDAQAFFQTGPGFTFQAAGTLPLAIDGQFHDLVFPLAGLTDLNVVDLTGMNLGAHANTLTINVDSITFVPEPASGAVLAMLVCTTAAARRGRRR